MEIRRDTREKITVAIDELAAELPKILDSMQKDMLERARKHRDAHTYVAHNMEELKDIADNKPGFIKAMWCGERECEDKLKEDAGITSHPDVCRSTIRSIFLMYAYVVENRRKNWYTGAKHIKKYGTQIKKQRKRL